MFAKADFKFYIFIILIFVQSSFLCAQPYQYNPNDEFSKEIFGNLEKEPIRIKEIFFKNSYIPITIEINNSLGIPDFAEGVKETFEDYIQRPVSLLSYGENFTYLKINENSSSNDYLKITIKIEQFDTTKYKIILQAQMQKNMPKQPADYNIYLNKCGSPDCSRLERFNGYCKQHRYSCSKDNCINRTSVFGGVCERHSQIATSSDKCEYIYSNNARCTKPVLLSYKFCSEHKCIYSGCPNVRKFDSDGFEPIRETSKLYCEEHRYSCKSCKNRIASPKSYCQKCLNNINSITCLHCRKPIKAVILDGEVKYGEYCIDHSCKLKGCLNKRLNYSIYCEEHLYPCANKRFCSNAEENRVAKNIDFCSSCQKTNTQTSFSNTTYCKFPGCNKNPKEGSLYCRDHSCIHCENARKYPSFYCGDHCCSVEGCSERRKDLNTGFYCIKHSCVKEGCYEFKYQNNYYCYEHYKNPAAENKLPSTPASTFNQTKCTFPNCSAYTPNKYCDKHSCKEENCQKSVKIYNKKDKKDEIILGKYCEDHSCEVKNCLNKKSSNSKYCETHGCTDENCPNLRKFYNKNNQQYIGRYCIAHSCNIEGCLQHKVAKGNYCDKHTCKMDGCYKLKKDKSDYCEEHSCKDPTCNEIVKSYMYNNQKYYTQYCDRHNCEVFGCLEPKGIGKYCTAHTCTISKCPNLKKLCTKDGKRYFSNYCEVHSCEVPLCPDIKKSNSKYCSNHTCDTISCFNPVKFLGNPQSKNCTNHSCLERKCPLSKKAGSEYCENHSCLLCGNPRKHEDGQYCEDHSCKVCLEQKQENSDYCLKHGCKICGKNKKDIRGDYCVEHSCKFCLEPRKQDRSEVGEYCIQHSCKSCLKEKKKSCEYCVDHSCAKETCPNPKKTGSAYCDKHTCQYGDCLNKAEFLDNGQKSENGKYCSKHQYKCSDKSNQCTHRLDRKFCSEHEGLLYMKEDFNKFYSFEQPIDNYIVSDDLKNIIFSSGKEKYAIDDKGNNIAISQKIPHDNIRYSFELSDGTTYFITGKFIDPDYDDDEDSRKDKIKFYKNDKKVDFPKHTYDIIGQGKNIYYLVFEKADRSSKKSYFLKYGKESIPLPSKLYFIDNFTEDENADIFCYSEDEKKAYQISIKEKNIIHEYDLEKLAEVAYPDKTWIVATQKDGYSILIWIQGETEIKYSCWKDIIKDNQGKIISKEIEQNKITLNKQSSNFGTFAHIYLSKEEIKKSKVLTKISAILYYTTSVERTFAKGIIYCQFNNKE